VVFGGGKHKGTRSLQRGKKKKFGAYGRKVAYQGERGGMKVAAQK